MKLLFIVRDLAAIVVLAFLALVLWNVHQAIGRLTPAAVNDLDEIHRATLEIGLTSENLRKATADWQASSRQQAAYFTAAAAQTQRDLADLDATLAGARAAVDALHQAIGDQNQALLAVDRQAADALRALQASANALQPVLTNAAEASANAARLTADPDLTVTLHQLAATSAATAGTAQNIESTTADIHAFVHRETSPARGTWNLIKGFLVEFGGPAAQIVTAGRTK